MIAKSKPAGNRAAVYLRMSSDKQEQSPEQQREAMVKMAKDCGYHIVRTFDKDMAISGNETDRRKDFQAMIAAAEKGAFDVIICWDVERFGRFDSIEAGRWIYPLRKAGVRLHTRVDGEIDWASDMGRLMYSMKAEAANSYLVKLSANTLRGLLASAKSGRRANTPTYGYDRLLFNERGEEMMRSRFGDGTRKPNNWTSKLVPSDDPVKIATVRRIFDQAIEGLGPIRIARALNVSGVVTAKGRRWTARAIYTILVNRAYIGEFAFGLRGFGRYHSVNEDGEIVAGPSGRRKRAPVIIEGSHEPLIDRKVFDAVQAGLRARATGIGFSRSDSYMLTGLTRCANCGESMTGTVTKRRHKTFHYYRCSGARTGVALCKPAHADARMIEAKALEIIADSLSSKAIADLRNALEKLAKSKTAKSAQTAIDAAKARLVKVERDIERGTANLLLADPAHIPAASKMLDGWREQREDIKGEIEQLESKAHGPKGTADVLRLAKRWAGDFHEAMKRGDAVVKRHFVRLFFDRINVRTEQGFGGPYVASVEFKLRPMFAGHEPKPVHVAYDAPRPTYEVVCEELIKLCQKTRKPARPCDVARAMGIGRSKAQACVTDGHRAGLLRAIGKGLYLPARTS